MLQKSAAEENTVLTSHASKIVVSGPVQQCKACVAFCASPIALAGCAPALDANRCTHDAGTQVTWRSIKHSACVNFSVKYPQGKSRGFHGRSEATGMMVTPRVADSGLSDTVP